LEPVRGRLLAPARGQSRRLPVPARRGVARRDGVRLAVPPCLVLGPAAVLGRPVGLDHLPAPPLRGGPHRRMDPGPRRHLAGPAPGRMVDGPAGRAGLRDGAGSGAVPAAGHPHRLTRYSRRGGEMRTVVASIESEYRRYKMLGEGAITQL